MIEAQLNIRSTKAKKLAGQLAKQQRRTVTQVVELALEHFVNHPPLAAPSAEKVTTESFWHSIARMSRESDGPDVDLEAIIAENRVAHDPIKL